MRHFLILVCLLHLIGCKSDFDKLQGHWHRITEDSRKYQTLDIEDSAVILNKSDRNGFFLEEKIVTIGDTIILPLSEFFLYDAKIRFKDDTLILSPKDSLFAELEGESKWIRVNDNIEQISLDFNANHNLYIDLEVNNNSVPFDSIGCKYYWRIINIGYPSLAFSEVLNTDSICLSTNSRFLDHRRLAETLLLFREEQKNHLHSFADSNDLILIINCDKNTPNTILDYIQFTCSELDYIKHIYRTCINQEKEVIGLYPIWSR